MCSGASSSSPIGRAPARGAITPIKATIADAPDMACSSCATTFCFLHDLQHAARPCAHYLEDQSKAQKAAERAERRLKRWCSAKHTRRWTGAPQLAQAP